jgi:hypothetical protein
VKILKLIEKILPILKNIRHCLVLELIELLLILNV